MRTFSTYSVTRNSVQQRFLQGLRWLFTRAAGPRLGNFTIHDEGRAEGDEISIVAQAGRWKGLPRAAYFVRFVMSSRRELLWSR
jgi:hypothetical protein